MFKASVIDIIKWVAITVAAVFAAYLVANLFAFIGVDARTWTIESKAAGSFVINANSASSLSSGSAVVDWIATPHYDP